MRTDVGLTRAEADAAGERYQEGARRHASAPDAPEA